MVLIVLDDNTYTNKTWAEVSGISVHEVRIMEVEFLSNIRYNLFVSREEWESWYEKLNRFGRYCSDAEALALVDDGGLGVATATIPPMVSSSLPKVKLHLPSLPMSMIPSPAPILPSPPRQQQPTTTWYHQQPSGVSYLVRPQRYSDYRPTINPRKRSLEEQFEEEKPVKRMAVSNGLLL